MNFELLWMSNISLLIIKWINLLFLRLLKLTSLFSKVTQVKKIF